LQFIGVVSKMITSAWWWSRTKSQDGPLVSFDSGSFMVGQEDFLPPTQLKWA
jgi:hypothetical protein